MTTPAPPSAETVAGLLDYLFKVRDQLAAAVPDKKTGFVTMWPSSRDMVCTDFTKAIDHLETLAASLALAEGELADFKDTQSYRSSLFAKYEQRATAAEAQAAELQHERDCAFETLEEQQRLGQDAGRYIAELQERVRVLTEANTALRARITELSAVANPLARTALHDTGQSVGAGKGAIDTLEEDEGA